MFTYLKMGMIFLKTCTWITQFQTGFFPFSLFEYKNKIPNRAMYTCTSNFYNCILYTTPRPFCKEILQIERPIYRRNVLKSTKESNVVFEGFTLKNKPGIYKNPDVWVWDVEPVARKYRPLLYEWGDVTDIRHNLMPAMLGKVRGFPNWVQCTLHQ